MQHPSANGAVIRHDDDRHQACQNAKKSPFRLQLLICRQRALFCFSSDGNLCGQQCKTERQREHQIHQQKNTATVLGCQIRKSPDITKSYSTSCCRQHKADGPGKASSLFFHDISS